MVKNIIFGAALFADFASVAGQRFTAAGMISILRVCVYESRRFQTPPAPRDRPMRTVASLPVVLLGKPKNTHLNLLPAVGADAIDDSPERLRRHSRQRAQRRRTTGSMAKFRFIGMASFR